RHTRSDRDWSSDVCSSDLLGLAVTLANHGHPEYWGDVELVANNPLDIAPVLRMSMVRQRHGETQVIHEGTGFSRHDVAFAADDRSEERRVGKERRARGGRE